MIWRKSERRCNKAPILDELSSSNKIIYIRFIFLVLLAFLFLEEYLSNLFTIAVDDIKALRQHLQDVIFRAASMTREIVSATVSLHFHEEKNLKVSSCVLFIL